MFKKDTDTCHITLGSSNIEISVGQAISSPASNTTPTQVRISSTRADLLAFHLGDSSETPESRSVKGVN
jgi:hypothetical protein